MKKFFPLLLLPFLIAVPAIAVSPNDDTITAKVISVYDGDTFTVVIDGEEEKVRLLGVDTPEMKANGSKTTCGGEKAKALTSALILNKEVTLVRDPQNDNRDAFGRMLRTAKVKGRVDIGILLLITGKAAVYEKADFAAKPLYQKLQANAKRAQRGIWGECGGLMLDTDTAEPAPAATPKPTTQAKPAATPKPTATPKTTPKPTATPAATSSRSCSTKVTCSALTTCEEAKYYLNTCGQKSLDRDGDGIPCDSLCG